MLRKTMPDNNKEHKDTKEHYRHIMLYYFRKGKSATQTCKKIHKVYGSDAVTSSTCRKWFQKFKDGNYEVKDAYRAGRPVITDVNKLRELVEDDRGLSAREIGKELNIAGATVSRHVKMLGLTRRKPDKKDRERAREVKKINSNLTKKANFYFFFKFSSFMHKHKPNKFKYRFPYKFPCRFLYKIPYRFQYKFPCRQFKRRGKIINVKESEKYYIIVKSQTLK